MGNDYVSDPRAGVVGSTTPGHYGVAESGVMLAQVPIAIAWNVQGDPSRESFVAESQRLFATSLPLIPNTTSRGAAWSALWLGPRSWLLVARDPSTDTHPDAAFTAARDVLNSAGGALFEVTASRVAFAVGGTHAANVLAKSCPLDFHPDIFTAGQCAQSLLGHVNALFYRPDATLMFIVIVARSFAHDVWHALCASAAQYGYDVAPA